MARFVEGSRLTCRGSETDSYGRLIALPDRGSDLGEAMVASGWATAFTRYGTDYVDTEERASNPSWESGREASSYRRHGVRPTPGRPPLPAPRKQRSLFRPTPGRRSIGTGAGAAPSRAITVDTATGSIISQGRSITSRPVPRRPSAPRKPHRKLGIAAPVRNLASRSVLPRAVSQNH